MEQTHKEVIKELVDLLHENGLSEIEYEISGLHLRLVGGVKPKAVDGVKTEAVVSEPEKIQNTIKSPMVGVVYLSSGSGTPFVKVGDTVHTGQVVCQIEAMKTFNPIKSDKTGKITQILVESGNPVEYDQPLLVVE